MSENLCLTAFVWYMQCLRPPYGVLYLAAKKSFGGSNGGGRHLKALVDEEGIFGAHVVTESADREIWKFFFKWSKIDDRT